MNIPMYIVGPTCYLILQTIFIEINAKNRKLHLGTEYNIWNYSKFEQEKGATVLRNIFCLSILEILL